jgi:Raf kinase inhibitor-like YbhB/YbcL family protein
VSNRAFWSLWLVSALVAGCGGGERAEGPPPAAPDRIELTSSAFTDGGIIPEKYSCDGEEVSPPLRWSGVPDDARELALLVEDPDAPGGTFVHWIVVEIPPDATEFPEGAIPDGAREGSNSKGETAWAGPCPPESDKPHHYEFLLYALPEPLGLPERPTADEVADAMGDSAIARGKLTGRFGR